MSYHELKARHQAEVNAFPFMFAFSQEQFDAGMRRWGLEPDETDKIMSIGWGGFIRKSDEAAMDEMFERHAAEKKAALEADKTGDGYIFEMFDYELANHEYGYTGDITPAIEALGLTVDDLNNNPALMRGLQRAMDHQMGRGEFAPPLEETIENCENTAARQEQGVVSKENTEPER